MIPITRTAGKMCYKHRRLITATLRTKRHIMNSQKYLFEKVAHHIQSPKILPGHSQWVRACTNIATDQVPTTAYYDSALIRNSLNYQKEGDWLHSLMQQSDSYRKTMVYPITRTQDVSNEEAEKILNQDWSSAGVSDILDAFKKLAYHAINHDDSSKDERYDCLLSTFQSHLHGATVHYTHIMTCLKYVQVLRPKFDDKVFKTFINKLSQPLCEALPQMSKEDVLLLLDLHYTLKERESKFLKYAVTRTSEKVHKLNDKQFIQLLFYISAFGKSLVNMYEMEYHLEKSIRHISMIDLAIAMRAFFCTNTPIITRSIITAILQKMIIGLSVMDSITFTALCKSIRINIANQDMTLVKQLVARVDALLSEFSIFSIVNFLHMLAVAKVYDESLFKKIYERIEKDLPIMRLKDIERFTFVMATISPEPGDHPMYKSIVSELRSSYNTYRREDVSKHPNKLLLILRNLSDKNVYDEELLNYVYGSESFRQTYLKDCPRYSMSYWALQMNILIDKPDYTGPLLEQTTVDKLIKEYMRNKSRPEQRSKRDGLFSEAVMHIQQVIGDKNVYLGYAFPQYASKLIVIGVDKDGKYVPVCDMFSELPDSTIKRVDTDEFKHIRWIAIMLIPHYRLMKDSKDFEGITKAEMRRLKQIGYNPVPVVYQGWSQYKPSELMNYIVSSTIAATKSV